MTRTLACIDGVNRDLRSPRSRREVGARTVDIGGQPLSNGTSQLCSIRAGSITASSIGRLHQPHRELLVLHSREAFSGTVVDPDGAVIAECENNPGTIGANSTDVTSTNVATSTRETRSDGEGHFAFTDVAPGPFQLSFTASGFAPLEMSGILHAGEDNVLFRMIALAVARNTVDCGSDTAAGTNSRRPGQG